MKKGRAIALSLALVFLLSLLPVSVSALPDDPDVVVKTERVYLALAGTAAGTAFTDSIPSSISSATGKSTNGNIRTYNHAFFLDSDTPTVKRELKVATNFIQVQAKAVSGLGPYTGEHINNATVYEFGFNSDGVAITHLRLVFDPYTGHGAPDPATGTIRIGQFGAAAGDIHNTYKYNANTKAYIVTGTGATLALTVKAFSDLVLDENDTIRIFYDYKGMTDKLLTEMFITEAAGVGTRAATYLNRYWSEGVAWNDPDFGYDGVENPYPVQFSLYDPVVHGNQTADAKYPLVIFFHGIGGGGTKTGVAGNGGWTFAGSAARQALFETNTAGVNGAFVMSARATVEVTTTGGQGWLTGYREDSNPRYRAGDEDYKGKGIMAAALIANVEWLLANNPNIDDHRIYLCSHSAGGYMVWSVLFEAARLGKGDLFAAAIPDQAAFFPSGGQINTDYSEVELGLEDKLLAVKETPIWLQSSLRDGTCTWACTTGDKFRMTDTTGYGMSVGSVINQNNVVPMTKIGDATTLYEAIANLKDVGGSELTRVSISLTMSHTGTILNNNNTYPTNTAARQGVSATTYTRIYAEQPADYNERGGTANNTLAYTFGSSSVYSDGSYEDTITDWFNACGRAKVKLVSIAVTTNPDKMEYTYGDRLDFTGMVVTATYSDGSRKEITNYRLSPGENSQLLNVRDEQILVGYTEGDVDVAYWGLWVKVNYAPISNLKIADANGVPVPAVVTVNRGSTVGFGLELNAGTTTAGVVWTTNNPALATVDANGVVTAKTTVGTVLLTAKDTETGISHVITLRII